MSVQRNWGAGVFGVTFGGVNCGIVQSVKLSQTKRPVSEAPVSHGLFTQRSMGNKELTPIEIEVALSGGRMEVLNRFKAIFDQKTDNGGGAARFDGAIMVGNVDGNCVQMQNFYNGLVTSFAFGDLDVGAKAAPTFKISIEPEKIETLDGDGSKIQGAVDKGNKEWLASNFRVTAAGLTTSHVTKVYGFTTKMTTSKQYVGEQDLPELIPGNLDFCKDGKIDFMGKTAKDWYAWHKQMVIDGDNMAEKDIVVEYLDTTLKKTLFTVTYHECGISDLATPQFTNNESKSALNTATLYVDRISFA
jgi:hypothetical protein